MTPTDMPAEAVTEALACAYGITSIDMVKIHAGTATCNYRATDPTGKPWFVKVYRPGSDLTAERAAVELALYAREGGVPVPDVLRTARGEVIARYRSVTMSVWEYLPGESAEGALTGGRWTAAGTAVGRLHRCLALHPAAQPVLRPGCGVCDLGKSRRLLGGMIDAYARKPRLSPFEAWASEAARERLARLPEFAGLLSVVPPLTVQVVHGDLASPNVLLDGDHIAGIIDFRPPRPRYSAWEVMRLGADPHSVLRAEDWLPGFVQLALAYRHANPATAPDEVIYAPRCGAICMLASAYPLNEPLRPGGRMDESLERYGHARHQAALTLLEHLEEIEETLRNALR
ncbi:phosphotransferase enzyme family protein [Streptomyces hiroshimensis]